MIAARMDYLAMPDPITLPKLRKTKYVAEVLDCSTYKVDRLRRDGGIEFVLVGNSVRFTDDQIAKYIEKRSVKPWQENDLTDQDKSADVGSANGPTAPCGAEPGSMPELGKQDVHRLAQRTFKRPSSD